MGCSTFHDNISDQELSILQMEHSLGYHKIKASKLDYTLRKHSKNYTVSNTQWAKFKQSLGIQWKQNRNSPKQEDFYYRFKFDDETFHLRNLLVLSLLLCEGSQSERAGLLFEAQDMENKGKLEQQDLHSLVELMVEVSINFIPTLVSNNLDLPADQEKITEYVQLLNECKEQGVKEIGKFLSQRYLSGEEERKSDFVNNARILDIGKYFRPHGIRNFMADLSKTKRDEESREKMRDRQQRRLREGEEEEKEEEEKQDDDLPQSASSSSSPERGQD